MVSFLSLFFLFFIIYHDVFVTVDAFATMSRAPIPIASISGRTLLWSSPKTTKLEKETSTDKTTELSESESTESGPEKIPVAMDAGIDAMMKEAEKSDESEEENLMQQIKDSGVAGVISYAAWELAFWTISVPVCIFGYREVTG